MIDDTGLDYEPNATQAIWTLTVQPTWIIPVSMMTNTVSDLIEQLGGRKAVAEALGCKYTAVSNWAVWNRLPLPRYLPMRRLCDDKHVSLPDALFERPKPTTHDP